METFDVVFEAGGAKGLAFIGALEVLLRGGHKVRRLIGTSAGAITATCFAAGFTPKELLDSVREKRDDKPVFSSFLDIPTLNEFTPEIKERSDFHKIFKSALDSAFKSETIDKQLKKLPGLVQTAVKGILGELNRPMLDALLGYPYFVQLFSLTELGGLYADRKFLDWLGEQLKKKGCADDITLKAFHEKTGRDLTLAVADISEKELLLLNHRTAPNCPVMYAVRMSMSIPFVWPEVVWRKEWGTYRGRGKAGNAIVDGSVLSNIPLKLLVDADDKEVREIMGAPDKQKVRNLGLLLDESRAMPDGTEAPAADDKKLFLRIGRLVEAVTGTWDEEILKQHPEEICRIGVKGVGVLEFAMNDERLEAVINSGRCAMTEYLQKHKIR